MTGGVDLCIRRHSATGLAAVLSRFWTVEINGSFYGTPSLETVHAWHDHTPKGFEFAWKASKFITHWKRLSDKCENSIALMESRLRVLETKDQRRIVSSFRPIFGRCGTARLLSRDVASML